MWCDKSECELIEDMDYARKTTVGHKRKLEVTQSASIEDRIKNVATPKPKAKAKAEAQAIANGEASVLRKMQSELGEISAKEVGEAAMAGDPLADKLIMAASYAIGVALAGFLHSFNPGRVVLGGGLSQMGEYFLQPIRNHVANEVIDPAYLCEIVPAELGSDVGILGALALAVESHKNG